jgi:hypothetical protein
MHDMRDVCDSTIHIGLGRTTRLQVMFTPNTPTDLSQGKSSWHRRMGVEPCEAKKKRGTLKTRG